MKRITHYIAFILGIFLVGYFDTWLSFLIVFLYILLLMIKYKNNIKFKNFICIIILFIIGASYFSIFNNHFETKYKDIKLSEAEGYLTVCSVPRFFDGIMTFDAKILNNELDNVKTNIKLYGDENILYGETYKFKDFKINSAKDKNTGTNYNSKLNLKSKSIYLTAMGDVENLELIKKANKKDPLVFLNDIKFEVNLILKQYFTNQEYMFLSGILLGNKDDNSAEFNEMLATTGLSHIVVVSGMHFSILMIFLTMFLRYFKLSRKIVAFIVILISIIIAMFMGFSASIIRSLIMIILINIANLLDRDNNSGINSIILTLFIMLIINPNTIYDIGFILSFSSVIGIVILTPLLNNKFTLIPYKIRNIINVSLSANIFTIPFLIFYFGRISLVFLLGNILLTPILPFIMLYGILSIMLGMLGIDITIFLNLILKIIIKTLEFISEKIPFAAINVISFSKTQIAIYFVVLSSFFSFKGKFHKIIASVVISIMVVSLFIPMGNQNTIFCLGSSDNGKNLILKQNGEIVFIDISFSNLNEFFLDNSVIKLVNMKNRGVIEHYILGNPTQIESLIYLSKELKIKNLYTPTEIANRYDLSAFNVITVDDKKTLNFSSFLLTVDVQNMYNIHMVTFNNNILKGIFTNIPIENNNYDFVIPRAKLSKYYINSYNKDIQIVTLDSIKEEGMIEIKF